MHAPSRSIRARIFACLLLFLLDPAHILFAAGAPHSPTASPAPAPTPSARELLRKTIEPFVDAFSREPDGPSRAFSARLRLVESSTPPAELRGATLAIRAEAAPANRILFQFPALGTIVTVCRQDQTVWAAPAARLAPILAQVRAAKLSKADQEPLAPLRLKIPTRLFWLLFYLEGVRDAGSAPLGPTACRQLDLDPPDGGKAGPDKYLRLWVRTDSSQIGRLDWKSSPAEHGTLAVEDLRFSPGLPASDFQPEAAAIGPADVLDVPAAQFRPFMKLLGQEEDKRRKAQKAHEQPSAAPTDNG